MTVHLDFRAPMSLSKYAVREMIAQEFRAISSSSRPPGERAYPKDSIYGGMKARLYVPHNRWRSSGLRTASA